MPLTEGHRVTAATGDSVPDMGPMREEIGDHRTMGLPVVVVPDDDHTVRAAELEGDLQTGTARPRESAVGGGSRECERAGPEAASGSGEQRHPLGAHGEAE